MTQAASLGRWLVGIGLTAISTSAVVLLFTSGIASGASSVAQYEYGHPAPLTAPVLSGNAQVGQTLTVSNGTWSSSSNVMYTYSWGRCDTGGNACAVIAGATTNKYTLVAADVGHTIRAYVRATNSAGFTDAASAQSAVVKNQPGTTDKTILAANVALPNRLVIDNVAYSQNPIRSRTQPTQMRVHVVDGNHRAVQNALVYTIGVPYSRIQTVPEVRTDANGWATMELRAGQFFPRTGYLVLFVRARVEGQDLLGGTSTRRLVQVTIGAPNGS